MSSKLENKFKLLWRASGGAILEEEFMFCPLRKWRSDFFHRPSNTLIEIEGGIWSGVGRHTSGKGYTSDALKYNVASYMGYRLFRLTSSLLTLGYVQDISKICVRQTPSEHFVLAKK
jgi:hypothetical protein